VIEPKIAFKIEVLLRIADPENNAPRGERLAAKRKAEELMAKYSEPPPPEPEPFDEGYDPGYDVDKWHWAKREDEYWWYRTPPDRVCPRCGENKPAGDFVWNGYWCWECRHLRSKEWV